MKYFLHDTSSFDDEKITELFLKFGYEGLGLFYTTLEKIGKQEKPIKTDVLKAQLRVGKKLNKCWSFMEEIGLISSNNGETFNEQLLNFSEKYQIKKEKTKEKVLQWRERQKDKKNVTGYVPECNPPKVKESKVKESKVNINDDFLFFWEQYHLISGKPKTDKEAALKKWARLTGDERKKAIEMIKPYCDTEKNKMYLKKARTYLEDKNFNDEIGGKNGQREITTEDLRAHIKALQNS